MEPATPAAYGLLHDGALALSRLESRGLPIDEAALDSALAVTRDQISDAESKLRASDVYYEQRKKYGKKANVNSREQLAVILYEVLKLEGGVKSDKGNYVLDDKVLENIDLDYCRGFQELQKLSKLYGTYLLPFKENLCKGHIHGFMNLHTVSTYRSSMDSPNLQNVPVRDPIIGRTVRSVVKSRDDDWVLVEVDYSALEVHIAACYHKDPTMVEFLENDKDMHTDCAIRGYKLDEKDKGIRTAIKTLFVFSNFYGDYYGAIARNMWEFAKKYTLKNGKKLVEHLADKGISHLGNEKMMAPDSFMQHIHDVDRWFWEQRHPVYDRWRKDWFLAYQRHGYFHTLTGFRLHGVFKRNLVINAPVQGSAFHCLLKSLIELERRLAKNKMPARLILQIHDSLLARVHKDYVEEYVSLANEVMTSWIKAQWPWITLRLKTEAEVGSRWSDKQPLEKWLKEAA